MKILILLSVLVSFKLNAKESSKTLRACKADEIAELVSDTNKDMSSMHMVNKKGEVGSAAILSGGSYAVADERGGRLLECAYLYKRQK